MLEPVRHWFGARLADDPGRWSLAIPMTAGALSLSVTCGDGLGGKLAAPFVVVVGILIGAYAALLGLLMHSGLMLMGGALLRGKARWVDLRAASGWASLPLIVVGAMNVLRVPLLGSSSLGVQAVVSGGTPAQLLELALLGVQVACWLATLVLTYVLAGVAQGFSAWKAVLGHVVGVAIAAVPVAIVAMLLT